MKIAFFVVVVALLGSVAILASQEPTAKDLVEKADAAFKKGETAKALELANQAIKAEPKNPQGYLHRAAMNSAVRKHKESIADYTAALELVPKFAEAYNRRGMEHFKLGQIKESITDFNKFLELVPKAKPEHWQRGISFYYAGMYKEGKEQFEGYQTFDDNDVENAVWRYLCMVPLVGKETAQKEILKIGEDKRVTMKQIYDLFAGKLKPQEVLDAARAGKPSEAELSARLFYAHLYLGLYYQSEKDEAKALEHLNTAVTKHPIGHYMWDVARVGSIRLAESLKK